MPVECFVQVPLVTIDDYRWLSGPGAVYLARAATHSGSLVTLAKSLRSELTAQQAHLVMATGELRRRARDKFPRCDQMFFTRQLLEQATGADMAAYKASCFTDCGTIADLCCGLGGDLLALSGQTSCIAVDRDPLAVWLAELNCRAHGRTDVIFHTADIDRFELPGVNAWHLDPDRRVAGRRTTRLEACRPGAEAISRLLKQCPHGAVKLAPATDELPRGWSEAQREWIGSRGECRQQIVWFGALARSPAQRTSTLIDSDGGSYHFTGESSSEGAWTKQVRRLVFEPHSVVLAAGLSHTLARCHDLARFSSSDGYWTGDRPIASKFVTMFEVEEVLPFDIKRIRAVLRARRLGRLEIKVRARPLDLARLRRQLKVDGDGAATLLIAGAKPHTVVVLAQRLARESRVEN